MNDEHCIKFLSLSEQFDTHRPPHHAPPCQEEAADCGSVGGDHSL